MHPLSSNKTSSAKTNVSSNNISNNTMTTTTIDRIAQTSSKGKPTSTLPTQRQTPAVTSYAAAAAGVKTVGTVALNGCGKVINRKESPTPTTNTCTTNSSVQPDSTTTAQPHSPT
eukprot:Tbor_TRINITY_DN5825_c3_g1::TRINITY_DN5825_c3_g1_i1::g.6698::m.6698